MNSIDTLIDKLHNDSLCNYLKLNHWIELPVLFDGKVRQFSTPDENDAIIIPLSKIFSDYYKVMRESLSTIAFFEHTSLKGLFNRLINPTSDILKWRIADDETSLGAISFNSMSNNIDYIKDMLSSTCVDILFPATYHKKVLVKEVQEQMATYRFGQTEIGSYILNIVCPLGYYQYELFQPDVHKFPLGRQVNIKLLRDIHAIQHSVITRSSQLQDEVAEGKISVNFLNALTNLYEENKDADFTISAEWNSYIPNIEDNIVSNVELQPRCVDKVVEIVETYSPKQEENVEKTYYGKIVNISGDAEVDNRLEITITIATIGDGGKRINVKAKLNYEQYFQTVDNAFQNGSNVKIVGIVESTTRTPTLCRANIERLD